MRLSGEIQAMIRLLDDPDDGIYTHVRDQLLMCGYEVIPELEAFWHHNPADQILQDRVEEIIQEIQFRQVKERMTRWFLSGSDDLISASIALASYQFPDIDEVQVRRDIETLKRDVWIELNDRLTALEQIRVVNSVFFTIHSFAPNREHYHDPRNSCINYVLESRRGNPLMLSLIYMVVCRDLNIPVYGINLPNHFVLGYVDHSAVTGVYQEFGRDVMFYVDPYNRGTIFTHSDVETFLSRVKIEPREQFFSPCDNKAIVQRIVRNLINSYEIAKQPERVKQLNTLIRMFEGSSNAEE
jgi:regulator of sirC expression with transglutaminase-like and TPR domain